MIDKNLTNNNFKDIYNQSLSSDYITNDSILKGEDQTDEEELQAEINQENKNSNNDNSEYEYVSISELSNGAGKKIVDFIREYYIAIAVLIIIAICLLLSGIGQYAKSIFLAIAFGVLVLGGGFILYDAWQEKKKTEAEYKHALSVIEPVKQKIKQSGEED